MIEKVKDLLDIRRNPFRDDEIELQEKAEQRRLLNQLVDKRKEIERNLSLIEDYFKKTCSEQGGMSVEESDFYKIAK